MPGDNRFFFLSFFLFFSFLVCVVKKKNSTHTTVMCSTSMQWVEKEVETPYGAVRTLHRAVVNEADEKGKDEYDDDDETQKQMELEEELERSADLLGSVLWNSITAALYYLHTHRILVPPSITTENERKKNNKNGASFLPSSTSPLQSLRVIELGAGVGSFGIALAMAGATTIISDIPELVPLMEKNIQCNADRLATKAAGKCVALGWKWGPSMSINVKKWWSQQRQPPQRSTAYPSSSSSFVQQQQQCGVESSLLSTSQKTLETDRHCSKKRKREEEISMTASSCGHSCASAEHSSSSSSPTEPHPLAHLWTSLFTHHSSAWLSALGLLSSSSSSSSPSLSSPPSVDFVILCDALYGNPKDWPALLFTLSEILGHNLPPTPSTTSPSRKEGPHDVRNTSPTTIFNFCEQRVDNVEKAFLELLEKENQRPMWRGEKEEEEEDEWKHWQQQLTAVMRGGEGGASPIFHPNAPHAPSPHPHQEQERVGAVVAGKMENMKDREKKRFQKQKSSATSAEVSVTSSSSSPALPPSEVYAQASQYLLLRRLRQMRGPYVWDYQSKMLHEAEEEADAEEVEGVEEKRSKRSPTKKKKSTPMGHDSTYTVSELKMPIRVTRITWKLRE